MNCPGCGRQARRGVIVLLLDGSGRLRGRKVCPACAKGGVTVVAPTLVPVVSAAKAERRSQREVLAPFVQNLEAQIKGHDRVKDPHDDEDVRLIRRTRIEVLEDVVALLKSGRA